MKVDQIERYLCNDMPPEERELFEKEMENNPSLRFDVQLVACVIRKTREVCSRRDKELVAQMLERKPHDRKRYIAVLAAMFVITFTIVASLIFFGYMQYKHHEEHSTSVVTSDKEDGRFAEYTNVNVGNNDNGDKMIPINIEHPLAVDENSSKNLMDTIKGVLTIDGKNPKTHENPIVNDVQQTPKEQSPKPAPTEINRYTYFPKIDSLVHSPIPPSVQKGYVSSCQVDGVWGAVERAFMPDKKSLQIDVVLNSKTHNTDVDEETFRYKTYILTDAGKKKSLYNFRYGSTQRSSFFLEKGSIINISLFFRGLKNPPSSIRELCIPAIHQDFVFRNIAIN